MGVIRKTASIEILLNEFKEKGQAIAATDLIKRLNEKLNKTTVYRVLDRLEDDGVLHSFIGADGIKWYAKCNGCTTNSHNDIHPHFECVKCGAVDCLNISIEVPNIDNRKVLKSHMMLQGVCEKCSN